MQHFDTTFQAAAWLKAQVTGTLVSDSRKVATGDGFIAWPGSVVDGRSFVPVAIAQGAAAILVEQHGAEAFALSDSKIASYAGLKKNTGAIASAFFGDPSSKLDVIAVTGTNGKTSTAWWLSQALTSLGAPHGPCGAIGTLGVGRAPDVVPTGLTTPDPVQLQQTLHSLLQSGCKSCAMEASSIGIEEHRLQGTRIRVALFTNLTQDHLDYHGSMEAYWESKRKLFAWPGLEHAVVNTDDVTGEGLAHELIQQGLLDVWTVSMHHTARLEARRITHGDEGLAFDVVEGIHSRRLQTCLMGAFNVSNLLGVIAGMRCLGVTLEQAVRACATLEPVPGRMQCTSQAGQPVVVVDYAHTPDALSKTLQALRPLAQRRGGALWCVFGCGGDRDASKRPVMGAIAAQHADHVVVTSDNPRGEKPESIIAQILRGQCSSHNVSVQVDRALAIAQTVQQAAPQDVILLAGKGHEATQEVAGVKTAFVDMEHANLALQQRGVAGVAA